MTTYMPHSDKAGARRTLLFDMDGTLIDSADGVFCSLNHALETVGIFHFRHEDTRYFLGPPLEQALREKYGCDEETLRLIQERYAAHYQAKGLYETAPVPGMPELVARLKKRGFCLAVATCKPWVYCGPIMEKCGFRDSFDAVSASLHNGIPENKVAVIREALRQTNAPPDSALMVGDRAVDVLGAKTCGLPSIGVDFCGYAEPGELEQAGALAVAHTVEELECFLSETT